MTWVSDLINAVRLPGPVNAGLLLFCALALLLHYLGLVDLGSITIFLVLGALLFGSLSFAALGGLLYDAWERRHKITLLARRRELRREEQARQQSELETKALQRLNFLTRAEVRIAANCLRKNEQSFTAWMADPHVATLIAKDLVMSPPGLFHRDTFPYSFHDFAWEALLARKDEFIAKDDENRREEDLQKQRAGRAR